MIIFRIKNFFLRGMLATFHLIKRVFGFRLIPQRVAGGITFAIPTQYPHNSGYNPTFKRTHTHIARVISMFLHLLQIFHAPFAFVCLSRLFLPFRAPLYSCPSPDLSLSLPRTIRSLCLPLLLLARSSGTRTQRAGCIWPGVAVGSSPLYIRVRVYAAE